MARVPNKNRIRHRDESSNPDSRGLAWGSNVRQLFDFIRQYHRCTDGRTAILERETGFSKVSRSAKDTVNLSNIPGFEGM